jgi:hypothetical protein
MPSTGELATLFVCFAAILIILLLIFYVAPQMTRGRGPRGYTGAKGTTGPIGLEGFEGATGPMGATGLEGFEGATGTTGARGVTGASGAEGQPGLNGAIGPAGTPGATGARGVTGASGAEGQPGLDGATGPDGPVTGPGIGIVLRLGGPIQFETGISTPILPPGDSGIVEYNVGNALTYNSDDGQISVNANGLYQVSYTSQMEDNGVVPSASWAEWFTASPTYGSSQIARTDAIAGIGQANACTTLRLNVGDLIRFWTTSTFSGQMVGGDLDLSPNRFSVMFIAPAGPFS